MNIASGGKINILPGTIGPQSEWGVTVNCDEGTRSAFVLLTMDEAKNLVAMLNAAIFLAEMSR